MSVATIYKFEKKGYLVFGSVKTVDGPSISADPYIRIAQSEATTTALASAVKASLSTNDAKRVPKPTNWKDYKKEFLQKTGLKSSKELNSPSTMCCIIKKENGNIFFTPTRHAEKPEEGFLNKSNDESNIVVSFSAFDQEIAEALRIAFDQCE